MKRIALVTLFPEMFAAIGDYGITGRALRQGIWGMQCFNPRDYTNDRHQTVDARPYGGGPGMVMMIEPLRAAIAEARSWVAGNVESGVGKPSGEVKVIYLSPQGRVFNQQGVAYLGSFLDKNSGLVLIAGRYEGVDERLIELEVDEEWSIGDYVLSGGELPAMVMIDALVRQMPGALGHQESALQDSFAEGVDGSMGLLDCPHYTRPEVYEDRMVPNVLLSGNHENIRKWRLRQALTRTWQRRPDLLTDLQTTGKLTPEQQAIVNELTRGDPEV
ncbi:MAG: tRNA (guanosine(37)-N1)-methyltransferase TrmD [Porticoccaceae bacterium]|nr:tRNA (guanosine(37)-N1)-methyltransferase TrmD [Porticoccaceae bacterium]